MDTGAGTAKFWEKGNYLKFLKELLEEILKELDEAKKQRNRPKDKGLTIG